ncbi:MAG: DUF4440 domain-containing protein [Saprospiraceae bacterium]|nr:DUF4440 domain-containing protein [Saprospiraceae bacterium]
MKFNQLFALVLCFAFSFSLQAQDMHPAYKTLEKAGIAYDSRDAAAFAANFTEDAILISPMGSVLNGKEAIFQGHSYFFQQMGDAPAEQAEQVWIPKGHQQLSDGLVFGVVADGDQEGNLVFAVVFEKQTDGQWLIKSVQMTPVIPMTQSETSN